MIDLSDIQSGDEIWFVKPGNLIPYRVKFNEMKQNRGNGFVSIFMNVGDKKDKRIVVSLTTIFNSHFEAEVFAAIEVEKYISNLKNTIEIETFSETINVARNIIVKCEQEFPDIVLRMMMSV